MATLAEIAPQKGDIVTSVCAAKRKGPAYRNGLPSLYLGMPLDTPGAKLRVTVFQVDSPNSPQRYAADHLTVLASTHDEKPGKKTTISAGYRNYLGAEADERVRRELVSAGVRVTVRNVDDETRLVVSPNSKIDNPNGRRIYIHQDAFVSLATQSPELAELIFGSLMRVTAIKTAHHHLRDAVDFGTLTPEQGEHVLKSLEAEAKDHLTTMMRQIGYRSPDDKRDFFPLIETDEHIEASCFENGYFTYATGVESGRIMFEDKEKLTEERLAVREGRGPKDLTIISRNIAQINPQVGTGLNIADSYFLPGQPAQIGHDEVEGIKNTVRHGVLNDIARTVIESIPWDTTDEDQKTALRGLLSACVSSLKSGIFKDVSESDDPMTKFTERRGIAEKLIVNFVT